MSPKTQLIAHDKEVFDIAFACGKDIFGTVGADGSLRMFDLRYLHNIFSLYYLSPHSDESSDVIVGHWSTQRFYMKLQTYLHCFVLHGIKTIPIISLPFTLILIRQLFWIFVCQRVPSWS